MNTRPAVKPIMESVTSSQIRRISYLEEPKILIVEFNVRYYYVGVSKELYEGLKSAESVGSFFHKYIKSDPEIYCFQEPRDDTSQKPIMTIHE